MCRHLKASLRYQSVTRPFCNRRDAKTSPGAWNYRITGNTDPLFDHDFAHFIRANSPTGQHLHVDAVVDNRDPSFDIQLFYYPSEVKPGAGGTRFIPGSHLRFTRAEGVSRYQNPRR